MLRHSWRFPRNAFNVEAFLHRFTLLESFSVSVLRGFVITAVAVAALSIGQSAFAQGVPFKASGENAKYYPFGIPEEQNPGDYVGTGKGTHLGRHAIIGNVLADGVFATGPLEVGDVFFSGPFEGSQLAIAANGDVLASNLSGDVTLTVYSLDPFLVEGIWFPEFTVDTVNSTGRFANASGAFSGVAINPPFDPSAPVWPFDWTMEGVIDLGKKGKK